MNLEADIKVRVALDMKAALARIADARGDGEKISDVAREAIREYLDRQEAKERRKQKKASPGDAG